MIICCGEALFDVFLNQEINSTSIPMEAVAGGSPFNVAIGIARLGGRSALLTGLSRDMLGGRLLGLLETERVSTDYLIRSGNRTTLSLVGVDETGQPAYVFYGLGSADCSVSPDDLPEIGPEISALHFGSYSIVARPVADAFSILLANAGDKFVSVDPNVRPTVEPDLDIWRERVDEYVARADLVKISTEDFQTLYPEANVDERVSDWLNQDVRMVVLTDGGEKVSAWTRKGHVARMMPPSTDVVDTVGAGDSFQAALLAKLLESGGNNLADDIDTMTYNSLEDLLEFAMAAARITCSRRGADLPRLTDIQTGCE